MRIANIKLTINGVDYQCYAKKLELTPNTDDEVLCTVGATKEKDLKVDMLLTYGAAGTFNTLKTAYDLGTPVVHIVQPLNATAAQTNPKFTFSAFVPEPPSVIAEPGKVGTFSYETTSTGGVVVTFA